jgi:hypothetical protein
MEAAVTKAAFSYSAFCVGALAFLFFFFLSLQLTGKRWSRVLFASSGEQGWDANFLFKDTERAAKCPK